MKKIMIATIVGLALGVSVSEAQTSPKREVPATQSREAEPPPPPPPAPPPPPPVPAFAPAPPPPPPPPLPPVPPVPPVPAIKEDQDVIYNLRPQDSVKMMIPNNEKGFVLGLRRENNTPMVIV